MIPAGEIGRQTNGRPGAEGATAPETLRQPDRKGDETLESRPGIERLASPKGVSGHNISREISQVHTTDGALKAGNCRFGGF